MKDVIIETIVIEYTKYCEKIDDDDFHWTEHEDYKKDLKKFMHFLNTGEVFDNDVNHYGDR